MNISQRFEPKNDNLFENLKTFLTCVACAVLPYYMSVYTVDYPYPKWVETNFSFYESVIRKSLGEEALYRLIPLALTIQLFGARWWVLFPVIVCSSVIFSLMHNGYISLLALGPGSIVLSFAFLFFGGLDRNYLRGFAWCSGVHIAINLVINVLVPTLI